MEFSGESFLAVAIIVALIYCAFRIGWLILVAPLQTQIDRQVADGLRALQYLGKFGPYVPEVNVGGVLAFRQATSEEVEKSIWS